MCAGNRHVKWIGNIFADKRDDDLSARRPEDVRDDLVEALTDNGLTVDGNDHVPRTEACFLGWCAGNGPDNLRQSLVVFLDVGADSII